MTVIDGEVWQPAVRWRCPSCSRTVAADGSRVSGRMCAADPVTGRGHPVVDMVRDVEQRRSRRPALEAAPPRRVLTQDELEHLLQPYVRSGDCPCGMVEVDNPVRREVRHRRGCVNA